MQSRRTPRADKPHEVIGGERDSLPRWVTNQLDALIGSGVLEADQLDHMDSGQLAELARRYVRRTAPPDVGADLAAVRGGRVTV